MDQLLSARFILLYALVASVLVVHLRGRERHSCRRQLTDHSTFFAPYNVLMYLFSAVPNRPYVPLECFPEVRPLLEHWKVLREEALRLHRLGRLTVAEERDDVAFNSLFRRGWKRFYLKWYDRFLPSAEELCPGSVALVRSVPSIHAALFALLPPGAKLEGHRDPFAGSLRLHLGLGTPNSDACRLYVDGVPYTWRDGEAVVFDETFIHRAVNDTDEPRIILFCDIDRPLRTAPLRALNRLVKRHLVRATAARNEPGERLGAVNRFSAGLYAASDALHRFKRRHRRLYRAAKYGILAGLFYTVFLAGLLSP